MWTIVWRIVKSVFSKKVLKAVAVNWKPILAVALVAFVYLKGQSVWDNYQEGVEEKNIAFTQMSLDLQAVEIERDRATQAVTSLLQQREMLAEIATEAIAEQEVARREATERRKVFEDHDVQSIADSDHEEWLSNLATEATTNYFMELQDAFNN